LHTASQHGTKRSLDSSSQMAQVTYLVVEETSKVTQQTHHCTVCDDQR